MTTPYNQQHTHDYIPVTSQQECMIKRMSLDELQTAINWAQAEGWNPGIHDADCFYAADPDGFFAGLVDGKIVSTMSAVQYDTLFGFLGLYIVENQFRKQGYGYTLFDSVLSQLHARTLGGDGVIDRLDDYAKEGFKLAHFNYRFTGTGGGECPNGVQDLRGMPFDDIRRYDRQYFPADRPAFLWRWISQGESYAFGVIQDGEIGGYGVIRKCHTGYKVGPLFADSDKLADRLFRALLSQVPGEQVFLDIPDPNPGAEFLVKRYNMTEVFSTGRIYRGPMPNIPMQGVYGLTSFELG